jgi:hypothetical protein
VFLGALQVAPVKMVGAEVLVSNAVSNDQERNLELLMPVAMQAFFSPAWRKFARRTIVDKCPWHGKPPAPTGSVHAESSGCPCGFALGPTFPALLPSPGNSPHQLAARSGVPNTFMSSPNSASTVQAVTSPNPGDLGQPLHHLLVWVQAAPDFPL